MNKEYNSLISVIIPTYNREKTILKSINSVLGQTYKNIEIIIVDDGSSDNTENIIENINDERVKYYKLNGNYGACYARNYGVKKCSGDYIAFQDSDDEFLSDKLSFQIKNLIKNDSDLDFCKFTINSLDNKESVILPNEDTIESFKKNGFLLTLSNGNFISTQSILMKKNVFLKLKFDEKLPRLQDYDFILRLSVDYKISFSNKALVNLYRQKDSISNNTDKLLETLKQISLKKYKFDTSIKYNIISFILNIYSNEIYKDKLYEANLENDKLVNIINNLKNENKVLTKNYEDIINSKRWKLLNKMCHILKK